MINRLALAYFSGLMISSSQVHAQSNRLDTPDRDVKVIQSDTPVWGQNGWKLSQEPVVSIDETTVGSAGEFTQISSLLILEGVGLAVTNSSRPPDLRLFDADGRHLITVGWRGRGARRVRAYVQAVVCVSRLPHRL